MDSKFRISIVFLKLVFKREYAISMARDTLETEE